MYTVLQVNNSTIKSLVKNLNIKLAQYFAKRSK